MLQSAVAIVDPLEPSTGGPEYDPAPMAGPTPSHGGDLGGGSVDLARRLAAVAALLCVVVAVGIIIFVLLSSPVMAVVAVLGLAIAAGAAVRAVVLQGHHRARWAALSGLGALALLAGVVVVALDRPVGALALVVVVAVGVGLGAYAERGYVRAGAAPEVAGPRRVVRSGRAVLFCNPASGGGKVGRFELVAEAERRGVRTVVLGRDDDLTALAQRAADDGAEVLGMAGGDGSQADVAAVVAARGLAFVCIPAGTRNHFALDLNLDRADPRRALDAFVEGIERRVDHGTAGGRFFVNNVSLGVYPYVVQDPSYRDGRLKAASALIPELLAPGSPELDLRFTSPDGRTYTTAQALLVSNNPYRGLGGLDGVGRRVSLDGGVLGVLVVAAADPDELARAARAVALGSAIEDVDGLDQWTTPSLRIDSNDARVLAGVDGEAMELPAPLDIRVVPGGLRVIVPIGTPEPPAPTAGLLSTQAIGNLLEIAGGVAPGPFGADD